MSVGAQVCIAKNVPHLCTHCVCKKCSTHSKLRFLSCDCLENVIIMSYRIFHTSCYDKSKYTLLVVLIRTNESLFEHCIYSSSSDYNVLVGFFSTKEQGLQNQRQEMSTELQLQQFKCASQAFFVVQIFT